MFRFASALIVAFAVVVVVAPPVAGAAPKKVETEKIVVPTKPVDPQTKGGAEAAETALRPTGNKGEDGLPPLVAKTRRAILEAAYSGDMAALRAVMQRNETLPSVSVNEVGDPIEYLKSQSGDSEGLEILAILTDVLEAGWAKTGAGTAQEMYVWPYFAAGPIDKLTPGELVELYKIVTSSDYEEMKTAGKYIFYAVGLGPDGTWHYFKVAD